MNKNKQSGAVKTVALMVAAMCVSKVLGMLRSVLMAHSYGISDEATVFSEASRIPLTFFDILLGSAILGCFIPIYNGIKQEDGGDKQRDVFASVFLNFVVLVTAVLSLAGIILARPVLSLIAAGLDDSLISMAVTPLRIMFPLIIFTGTTYTLVGVLQSKNEFLIPALVSALSNLLVIVYFVLFDRYFGIIGLSVCYTLSWLVQLLTLVPSLVKHGFKYVFCFDFKNKNFLQALKMTPPIMCGAWLTPVSILLSLYFAAFVNSDGAVASFEYANNLFTIIVGILTYGVCNFVFPRLSRLSGDSREDFVKTASDSLFYAFMIILPVMTAMTVIPEQVVCVIYKRGEFGAQAVQNVTSALRMLVPGMLGFTAVEVLNRVFYAQKSVYIPMLSALCGIAVNALSSYIMIIRLNMGLGALGLGFALGLCGAAAALMIFSAFKIPGMLGAKFWLRILRLALCGAAGWIAMKLASMLLRTQPADQGLIVNLAVGAGIFVLGAAVYVLFCKLLGLFKTEVIK